MAAKQFLALREDFKAIPLGDAILLLQAITPADGIEAKVSLAVSYYKEKGT